MPVPSRRRWTLALLALGLLGAARPAAAQIRGSRPRAIEPNYGWWFSGGANGAVVNDIIDGQSNTRWKFGSDPLWQLRGTLEKALDPNSTLGLAVGYGVVDVNMSAYKTPFVPSANTPGSACATTSCLAQTEMWSAMGQFRSGGGQRGFQTLFVLTGGVNAFRNFRVKATGDSIPGLAKMQTDLAGTIGGGVAYALGSGTAIELIQDFGMGWHSKTGLTEGDGRTYRSRTTRAGLRFHFGGNR
ncbi:MAG: hypothetical protein K2R93_03730 [Gemmatimonadaceae bacterium]|nr:hypothetical protein [Gemmatimonadaceae bacterium]